MKRAVPCVFRAQPGLTIDGDRPPVQHAVPRIDGSGGTVVDHRLEQIRGRPVRSVEIQRFAEADDELLPPVGERQHSRHQLPKRQLCRNRTAAIDDPRRRPCGLRELFADEHRSRSRRYTVVRSDDQVRPICHLRCEPCAVGGDHRRVELTPVVQLACFGEQVALLGCVDRRCRQKQDEQRQARAAHDRMVACVRRHAIVLMNMGLVAVV